MSILTARYPPLSFGYLKNSIALIVTRPVSLSSARLNLLQARARNRMSIAI